jgi:hypothetical protein
MIARFGRTLLICWSVGILLLPHNLSAETLETCMEHKIDDLMLEGRGAQKVVEKIVAHSDESKGIPAEPNVSADQLPYQDLWEGLHVPKDKSKAPPIANNSRPERVLYFRPKDGEAGDFAVAHSIVGNRVVRRETLEVYQNPETGTYELRAGLDLADSSGRFRKGSKEELETCLSCHSVSPEGKHLIFGKPTPDKYPELHAIPSPGQPERNLLPRWLGRG